MARAPEVARVEVAAYRVPTDAPESDGTIAWDQTTAVVVHATAGDAVGLGYTYADLAAAGIIARVLAPEVSGRSALDVAAAWEAMVRAVRNIGRPGVASMAISAVDCALWDLKARLLGVPLVGLFGAFRDAIPAYGSGGFTSYDEARLTAQLGGWAEEGLPAVKMKVGRDEGADPARVRAARAAIGEEVALFVDANGAWSGRVAGAMTRRFAEEAGVSWVEEPRPSDDLVGLRRVRDGAPAGVDIAAGEYAADLWTFRRMLAAGAVDCLQADVTRCGGYTGFLAVAALADAFQIPLSTHCAPQQSAHAACAARVARHIEYFHDHVRVEGLLFDGALRPEGGGLRPDRERPGHGLTLKRADAERYRLG